MSLDLIHDFICNAIYVNLNINFALCSAEYLRAVALNKTHVVLTSHKYCFNLGLVILSCLNDLQYQAIQQQMLDPIFSYFGCITTHDNLKV